MADSCKWPSLLIQLIANGFLRTLTKLMKVMLSMRIWNKNLVLKDCKRNKIFIHRIHNLNLSHLYYPSTKAIHIKMVPTPKLTELLQLLVLTTPLTLKAYIKTCSHWLNSRGTLNLPRVSRASNYQTLTTLLCSQLETLEYSSSSFISNQIDLIWVSPSTYLSVGQRLLCSSISNNKWCIILEGNNNILVSHRLTSKIFHNPRCIIATINKWHRVPIIISTLSIRILKLCITRMHKLNLEVKLTIHLNSKGLIIEGHMTRSVISQSWWKTKICSLIIKLWWATRLWIQIIKDIHIYSLSNRSHKFSQLTKWRAILTTGRAV